MQKVLLVEDAPFIQDIYLRTFKKAGYEIENAKDGEEAVEKAKNGNFDVVLLDLMLPKMDGLEVIRILRKPGSSTENTPIFLVTNLGQDDVLKKAFDLGADGYFIKAQMDASSIISELEKYFAQKK